MLGITYAIQGSNPGLADFARDHRPHAAALQAALLLKPLSRALEQLVTSFVYIVDGGTTANEDGSSRCPNGLCVVLASLVQIFNLSAIIWNTYIALNMHLTVLLAARIVKDEPRYMRWLHAGAWGPALLSTLITGAAGGLGSAGQWCWIRRDFAWAQVLFYYLPVVLSLLYSLAVYLRVRQRIVSLRRNASMAGTPAEGGSSTLNELMHRFVSFLAVYGAPHPKPHPTPTPNPNPNPTPTPNPSPNLTRPSRRPHRPTAAWRC